MNAPVLYDQMTAGILKRSSTEKIEVQARVENGFLQFDKVEILESVVAQHGTGADPTAIADDRSVAVLFREEHGKLPDKNLSVQIVARRARFSFAHHAQVRFARQPKNCNSRIQAFASEEKAFLFRV